jgi:putative DNA primase/helicase
MTKGKELDDGFAEETTFGYSEQELDVRPPKYSDDTLALRFTRKYRDILRYTATWGKWQMWNGQRWKFEETLHVFDLAREICRIASTECRHRERLAIRVASASTIAAVEKLARADRRHAVEADLWDANPWLLNTPNGTVDLKTGELILHRRDDYLTRLTAVTPQGDCPVWRDFLRSVTADEPGLQAFLQRMVGYCLTGTTREHAMFFLFGTGANGKSVFISTILGLLGTYGRVASMETFMASNGDRHPTDLAGLHGSRLVTAVETEEGKRWAESKIKTLTGGDKVSARFMRKDFFDFVPQFKLVIAGNHKPGLRSVDEAIRRRLVLVPFMVTIPDRQRDPELAEKLKAEWPGVLQWAIDGCISWQRAGLGIPATVRAATEEYLAAEDAVGRWIEEKTVLGRQYSSSSTALYEDWSRWCEANREFAGSQKFFSQRLEQRPELRKERSNRVRSFQGIALRSEPS